MRNQNLFEDCSYWCIWTFSNPTLYGSKFAFLSLGLFELSIIFINGKASALECLKSVKAKWNQIEKKIKIVRCDSGRECYEKYDESIQLNGPFANYYQ